jgi:hypothetical protein
VFTRCCGIIFRLASLLMDLSSANTFRPPPITGKFKAVYWSDFKKPIENRVIIL